MFKKKQRGFTLVEILVAGVILALFTVTMVGMIAFSSKATRLNTNSVTAKNIAQGYFERMAIDTFANVNSANYPSVTSSSNPPVYLDQAMDIRCAVAIDFKGFGTASGGGNSSLSDSSQSWEVNEWANDSLFIVGGKGAGQTLTIISNTADTITVNSNWVENPDATSKYMINNGKTVEITTTWQYQGQSYSRTIESLVVNYRNDENLGF